MKSTQLAFVVVVALAIAAPPLAAQPLEVARIFIEFNDTDQDVGVHMFVDGEWQAITVKDPEGDVIFEVEGKSALAEIGLAELFVEGEEPSLDELPLDELFELFPEGLYTFEARSEGGERVRSKARFTHDIPGAPVVVTPTEGEPVDRATAVIDWEPVTTPAGIQIVGYEVIVEDDHGNEMSIRVPAWLTRLRVPPEILRRGREYDFEVIAIERGGNQTITESSFETVD